MKLLLLLLCSFHATLALRQTGTLKINSNWGFIAKFCYSKGYGNLTWTGRYSQASSPLMLFYDDVDDSWPSVYASRNSLSCGEKVARSMATPGLTPGEPIVSGQENDNAFLDTLRPHYWYVALADCSASSINIEYDLHFWNDDVKCWDVELGYDEQGLPAMYLFFWLLFMLASAAQAYGSYQLWRTRAFHPIIQLLTAVVGVTTLAWLAEFIHYIVFANNGIGVVGLKGFGNLLDLLAQCAFLFLLLLIAKGWAITRHHITDKKVLIVGASLFLLAYLAMYILDEVAWDPAGSVYMYDSIPGIIVVCLRVLAMLWFLWSIRQSHLEESHPNKRRFYIIFGATYLVWFLMLPLVCALAAAMPPWERYKVVQSLYVTTNAAAIFVLQWLLWPSRAAEYFQISRSDLLVVSSGFGASSPYETL
eukprot:TRINITY_DN27167_c0_g1_i1.p1 TRINITY_DN27167_c0_g1~~TRINITY_DN27167_c0_g1_i1.p1  ORF type:complete len:420 (-),score=67.38 TRINITY_DN27167_c0_g1_i1:290-1549(-)